MSLAIDPEESAESAGLRYVTDAEPGIRRHRAGRGFRYTRPDGTPEKDSLHLAWIRSLAIPPAWTDVWICRDRRGHLQATGRDARGRKVYRYHPDWRRTRDETKYERLAAFGRALPRIRRRVRRDIRRSGWPLEKVVALVVALLDAAPLRIGNEPYARQNRSFGLTTLRGRHVTAGATTVRFRFRGKSGKITEASISDPRLARLVARLQELPGQELFQYRDQEGELRSLGSDEVNAYLGQITGGPFTAKDFRTWEGSVVAATALADASAANSADRSRSGVVRAIEQVAKRLNNTPAVARRAYVHPEVVEAYLDGSPLPAVQPSPQRRATGSTALSAEESALLQLLERRATAPGRRRRAARSSGRRRGQAASNRSRACR